MKKFEIQKHDLLRFCSANRKRGEYQCQCQYTVQENSRRPPPINPHHEILPCATLGAITLILWANHSNVGMIADVAGTSRLEFLATLIDWFDRRALFH